MKQIPVQQDDVTSLAASDFNQIPREEENLITSAGQSLSESDLFQMDKAVAVYASSGDFYTDGGSTNAFSLTPLDSKKSPHEYALGMRVRFKVANTNTATGVTCQVTGLSAISMHVGQLANGGTPSVPIGSMPANKIVEAVYDQTPDTLTNYFRINQVDDSEISDVSLSKLTNGQTDIQVNDVHMIHDVDQILFEEKTGGTTRKEFAFLNKDALRIGTNDAANSGSISIVGPASAGVSGPYMNLISDSTTDSHTRISGKGIRYNIGPGDAGYKSAVVRKSEFAASVTWNFNSGVDPFLGFNTTSSFVLTGIPAGTTIHRVSIRYDEGGGLLVSAPVYARYDDLSGERRILKLVIDTGGITPPSSIDVLVEYNGSGL
jgi:hypothetical protein